MKRSLIILVAFLFLMPKVGYGQDVEQGKIAYVDLSRVFDEYNKTKELDKELEKKGEDKQGERDKKVAQIKRLKDELELLSEDARQKKQAATDEMIKELQDFDRATQTELKQERDSMVREILQEIDKVIQEYGEKQGYEAILNDRVLLYGRKEADLTNEILKILNEKYKKR